MGRKKKTDPDAISHLAHDVLIIHLFELFDRLERQKSSKQRRTYEAAGLGAIDPRALENAMKGHGINPKSADKIAKALSRKLAQLIEASGGAEKVLDEMKTSLAWSNPARAFQWLEDRILGKPPYILQNDILVNRNDRHLIDDYQITLAVAPTPNAVVNIEYPDRPAVPFNHTTTAALRYAVTFSPHNRNHQADFTLRYSTNDGRLEVIEPGEEGLKEPALYRRHRSEAIFAPKPRISMPQHLSMLVYGGYGHGEERAHFSFTQPALYRRVTFTLDLSAYPDGCISGLRLFVVCKLPGRAFDCCKLNAAGEGQTIKPDEEASGRCGWRFESFEQMMIGVHWAVDHAKLPEDIQVSREELIAKVTGA
jgi:hypothetical protein